MEGLKSFTKRSDTGRLAWAGLIVSVGALVGCSGSSSGSTRAVCEGSGTPSACGVACVSDIGCGNGFHCSAGTCTAECSDAIACPAGEVCSSEGRCELARIIAGGSDAGGLCATVDVGARRVTPKVTVIVDQSGSMGDNQFPLAGGGTDTRWNVVRDALIGPDGVITRLDNVAEFGLSLYTAREDNRLPNLPTPGTECPEISAVPVAANNRNAIASVYEREEPIDETPTGDAIEAVLASLRLGVDPDPNPSVFILATDGNPDRCEQLNHKGLTPAESAEAGRIARAEATDAVTHAFEQGVRTFVLGVGEGTVTLDHLQDLANSGLGRSASDPPAPYWVAGDQAGLADALSAIVGQSLSCEVRLDGRIDVTQACTGTVSLNDEPLPCDDPNGWRAIDESSIELVGTACERLKTEPAAFVAAAFSCETLLI